MKRTIIYAFLEVCTLVAAAVLLAINARWLNVPPTVVEQVSDFSLTMAVIVGAILAVLVTRDIAKGRGE